MLALSEEVVSVTTQINMKDACIDELSEQNQQLGEQVNALEDTVQASDDKIVS